MLINNIEAESRLSNPMNLLERMRNGSLGKKNHRGMNIFIKPDEQESQAVPEVVQENQPEVPTFVSPFSQPAENTTEILVPSDLPVKVDDLLNDADADIALSSAHNKALGLMAKAMNTLEGKIDNVKSDKLPSVISALGRVVTDIRKERVEREKTRTHEGDVHYHFYCPNQKKVEEYEIIEVAS